MRALWRRLRCKHAWTWAGAVTLRCTTCGKKRYDYSDV